MLYVSAVVAASVIVSRSSDNYGDDRKLEKDICTSFSHAHTHKDDDDNLYMKQIPYGLRLFQSCVGIKEAMFSIISCILVQEFDLVLLVV